MSQIERLLRKELRKKVSPNEPIYLINNRFSTIAASLLRQILPYGPKILLLDSPTGKENEFFPTSEEEYLSDQLSSFFQNTNQQHIAPLMETIPEKLLIDYAKLHNLQVIPTKNSVLDFIEEIQQLQPQTKPALQKSFDNLRKHFEGDSETDKKN